jgi:hypothetical protein
VRGPPRLPRPCIGYPKIRLLFAPTMSLERIRCCYIQKQPTCAHKRRSLLTASCVSTNRVRGVGRERNRIHLSGIRSRRKSGLKVGGPCLGAAPLLCYLHHGRELPWRIYRFYPLQRSSPSASCNICLSVATRYCLRRRQREYFSGIAVLFPEVIRYGNSAIADCIKSF